MLTYQIVPYSSFLSLSDKPHNLGTKHWENKKQHEQKSNKTSETEENRKTSGAGVLYYIVIIQIIKTIMLLKKLSKPD